MGRLIVAEFRKTLTTKSWWALIIVAFLLALGWAAGVGALIDKVVGDVSSDGDLQRLGVNIQDLSLSVLALSRSINVGTILPMLFGALGIASEMRNKTITTTFLTASTRGAVLGAKAITYLVWGALFGVVIVAGASIGVLVATSHGKLPDAGAWMLMLLAGVISSVLWTLLGLGVGALLGSPVAAVITLLVYALLIGPIGDLVLFYATNGGIWSGLLPNGSANGITGSTAGDVLISQIKDLTGGVPLSQKVEDGVTMVMRAAAGAQGALEWWATGLIFLAWTAVAFGFGLLRTHRRDLT